VDDLEAGIEFLRSKGVEVQDIRIDEITLKRFAFFSDPNGQPLELCEE
jgi:glyoxylase I family protein